MSIAVGFGVVLWILCGYWAYLIFAIRGTNPSSGMGWFGVAINLYFLTALAPLTLFVALVTKENPADGY